MNPLETEITCIIKLIDVNDNFPQFDQTVYYASIYEDALPKTRLTVVSATDRDSGDFGKLRYTSLNGLFSEK